MELRGMIMSCWLLLILLVFVTAQTHPVVSWSELDFDHVICVGNGWNTILENCTQMDLTMALLFATGTNYTLIQVAAGQYTLSGDWRSTDFYNTRNIALVGNYLSEARPEIVCDSSSSRYGTGLGFFNSSTIRIEKIAFKNCGRLRNSTTLDTDQNSTTFVQFNASIYFLFCKDISLDKVSIVDSDGTGLVMYNCLGDNSITDSKFSCNRVKKDGITEGGGGAVIEYSHCNPDIPTQNCTAKKSYNNSTFKIRSCLFEQNYASTVKLGGTYQVHHKHHSGFGRGGGLSVSLSAEVANISILINSSCFHGNNALLGSGIYYKTNSKTNKIVFHVINTLFMNNSRPAVKGITHGGAVNLNILANTDKYDNQSLNDKVNFTNCSFFNNFATTGGAVSLVVFRGLHSMKMITKVIFSQCNFNRNMARVGSAVLAITWTDQTYGYMTTPDFNCCSFTNNIIYSKNNAAVGMGAIYSDSVPLHFIGNTTFSGNNGTALVVSSTSAHFEESTSTTFSHNRGDNGGAIALLNRAWLEVCSHTDLTFSSNFAKHKGGAIYSASFGEQNVVAAFFWKCFIRHKEYYREPSQWNATLYFDNNTAKGKPNSIYATSIQPCIVPSSNASTDNLKSVFCSWKGWNFTSSCQHEVNTSSAGFSRTDNQSSSGRIEMFPGLWQSLPFSVYDDWDNDITKDTMLKASISNNTSVFLDSNSELTTMSGLKIHGYPKNVTEVVIETMAPRVLYESFQVELIECPLGMEMNTTDTYKQCICGKGYSNTVICSYTESKSTINPNWCMTNSSGIPLVGKWMLANEVGDLGYYELPKKLSGLSEICANMNRKGRMCSMCAEGYGFAVFTLEYPCVKCDGDTITPWLLYVAVEFVPVTIFFLVVVFFNININSGKTNALVCFCQMVSLPVIFTGLQSNINIITDIESLRRAILLIILLPYNIWSFDSLKLLVPPFCLLRDVKMIHILCFNYVTAVYPLILVAVCYLLIELHGRNFRPVVLLWVPFRKCFGQFHRSFEIKTSVIEAFASFLVLSYMKFAQVTAMLLIPNLLYHSNGMADDLMVLLMDASVSYFSHEHFPYFVGALLVLLFILIFPPLFLFLYPFRCFRYCLKCCHLWGPTVTTFADAFLWCYKDGSDGGVDCRFFASFYLFARLFYVIMLIVIPVSSTLELAQVVCAVIVMLTFSLLQPYKRKFYTHLDCTFISLMILLPMISLYLESSDIYHKQNNANILVSIMFITILLLPQVYMFVLFTYEIGRRIKGRLVHKRRVNLGYQPLGEVWIGSSINERVYGRSSNVRTTEICVDFSESVPHRLLHPNSYSLSH